MGRKCNSTLSSHSHRVFFSFSFRLPSSFSSISEKSRIVKPERSGQVGHNQPVTVCGRAGPAARACCHSSVSTSSSPLGFVFLLRVAGSAVLHPPRTTIRSDQIKSSFAALRPPSSVLRPPSNTGCVTPAPASAAHPLH